MSNTRYNKIIKINDSYLAVNSIVPILLAKRLKNGALLRKKDTNEGFTPSNFKLVNDKAQATIFTPDQAILVCEAFDYYKLISHQKNAANPQIINIGPKYQSQLRQLTNIKEVDTQRQIPTSTTKDFDSIERFNELTKGFSSPQITKVDVDLTKYQVDSITVQTKDRDNVLANVIDLNNRCVKVLSKNHAISFEVGVSSLKDGHKSTLGYLESWNEVK